MPRGVQFPAFDAGAHQAGYQLYNPNGVRMPNIKEFFAYAFFVTGVVVYHSAPAVTNTLHVQGNNLKALASEASQFAAEFAVEQFKATTDYICPVCPKPRTCPRLPVCPELEDCPERPQCPTCPRCFLSDDCPACKECQEITVANCTSMIIHRFWAAITGMHVLGSVLVASFWPQFSHILTPLQANGNCSFSNTFGRLLLMIVALLETVFLVVYHVVYHVLSYLYAQNSDVSVNWLGSAAMVVTGCMFASYYAWDSARKQRLASTRKQVQQHIEDCQWILRFDDKIRFVVRNQQEPPDFESDRQANAKLIAYMEFVEKQDLVHDQDLKDNIQPFLTAARQHPPSAITWNTDYEDKAGQLCTWLGKIEQIVQGTHECVKILTAKEDQRLLLRLKIAYLNLWEVVGRFHDLTITLTGNQTNANWNELQECVLKTLENREALYPPKKRINNTKPSTSGTLVDVSREKK